MSKRTSMMNLISSNPILAETWKPEALAQTQQQITEQVATSHDVEVPRASIHLDFSFTPTRTPLRYYYDPEQIAQWAEADIKVNGILSPIWVRPLPSQFDQAESAPAYELIAGMRRYLAAQHLNLENVPVKVFHWTDEQCYQAATSENLNRKEFSPVEELDHILYFLSRSLALPIDEVPPLLNRMANAAKGNIDPAFLESEPAQAVQQVFASLGQMSWRTFVQHRLRLRNKPADIITAIRDGKLSYHKAMIIAAIKDDETRSQLIEQAASSDISLEAITAQVDQWKQSHQPTNTNQHPVDSPQESLKALFKQVGKNHPVWKDPKRVKKLEKYLSAIRSLLDDSSTDDDS